MAGKSLRELRQDVDAIDDTLHDLLMRRAEVTDAIARTKPHTGGKIALALAMRPAREAEIMRRLVTRHRGTLSVGTVVRVAREVLAASLRAQTPFALHVCGAPPELASLARAYFGCDTQLTLYETPSRVMNACGNDPDSLGIVPIPEGEGEQWWARLAPAESSGPRVIARLPFLKSAGSEPAAYVIAAIEQEATGDDTTLLLAEVAPSLSRTRLLSQLKDAGFAARIVAGNPGDVRAPVLLEADGFVASRDPRLAAFCAAAEAAAESIFPVGGFANPVSAALKEPAQ